ncbi:MAG: AMP-binding protein [Polyangiales bacterium]
MKHAERGRRGSVWRNLIQGTQNALEIARAGRLAPEVRAPFAVVRRERVYKLRRYERTHGGEPLGAPLLLIPPLMVTPEVYDIDPTTSAVRLLTEAGVDVFLVDFGIPELEEGGLARTLDDHVRAVDQAIEQVRAITGSDLHLAGYSQGGMFCYQACAYRRGANIKSIITYGAPVDLHRNLLISRELAARFIDSFSGATRKLIDAMEGLPGAFSSYGFRVLSVRKELKQLVTFVANLHDREALMRGESSRRFLHGEGFVYWPGPALRTFFDEFVVDNRLSQGGFVVDGRSLTLADITCPIFYFHGERDQFARADSVRAIAQAAPLAPSYGYGLRTGHFGLVVGSVAMKHTWPATVQWIAWLAGKAERPEPRVEKRALPSVLPSVLPNVTAPIEENLEEVEYNARLLYDTARGTAKRLHKSLHDATHAATGLFDNVRYQLPRLGRLGRLSSRSYVSCGRTLAEQAARIGDHTFFLWEGRAHTYAAADRRVDAIVRGLIACAVTPNERVGVMMHARPTYLSLVAAISRLGAVAVLISPEGERVGLKDALRLGEVQTLICDPEHAARARETFKGPVLVLGGGAGARTLVEGVIDMERIDPDDVDLPDWYEPNPGRASDLAMILFTAGKDEQPRAARITNRRWAVAAYGAAAASTLTSKDTVYCCMPLHHAAGLLVSVGGALVGGSRLALSDAFQPDRFWTEVRRYGATVVFYAGEMCRALVDAPPALGDANNPVRLFAGSGMRVDVWHRLLERFNAGVLEFYATTEGNAVLANVSGGKVGSLGKPLPGTSDLLLAAYDFDAHVFVKGPDGSLQACFAGQPGMLIARIDSGHPMAQFDGFVDERESARRVLRDAVSPGDVWFVTGDVLRIDADGDYWFVDRAADMIRTPKGPVASVAIEDALYELDDVQHAVAYGVRLDELPHDVPVATVVLRAGRTFDGAAVARHLASRLDVNARPRFLRLAGAIEMSVGYRPLKHPLRAAPPEQADEAQLYCYDHELEAYAPSDEAHYARSLAQLRALEQPAPTLRTLDSYPGDLGSRVD